MNYPITERRQDMLDVIFERQLEFQRRLSPNFDNMSDEERANFITYMAYALEDEIHEATSEVGWKIWASSRHLNRERYVKELIDALHFLVNLFLAANVTPDELFALYLAKMSVNHARQDAGYDGVSTKCTVCHRDMSESDCTSDLCMTVGAEPPC